MDRQIRLIWAILGLTVSLVLVALLLVRHSLHSHRLLYAREAQILDARGLSPSKIKENSIQEQFRTRSTELWYLGHGHFEYHAPPTIRLILIKNANHQNQGKMDKVEVLPHYVRYSFSLPLASPITVVTNGGTFVFKLVPLN